MRRRRLLCRSSYPTDHDQRFRPVDHRLRDLAHADWTAAARPLKEFRAIFQRRLSPRCGAPSPALRRARSSASADWVNGATLRAAIRQMVAHDALDRWICRPVPRPGRRSGQDRRALPRLPMGNAAALSTRALRSWPEDTYSDVARACAKMLATATAPAERAPARCQPRSPLEERCRRRSTARAAV
jgi:hypothetical protein